MNEQNKFSNEINLDAATSKTIDLKENIGDYSPPSSIKSTLVKPDFSPIINSENKFIFKTNGSYKKRKISEPESPMRLKSSTYLTTIKIEGRNLFGNKPENHLYHKLKFDKDLGSIVDFNKSKPSNFMEKTSTLNEDEINKKTNKLEDEYIILKTIIKNKSDEIYKVQEKKTKKIYCIKKTLKNSEKNSFDTIKNVINDFKQTNSDDKNIEYCSKFCLKYLDYWVETNDSLKSPYNENLFILANFYENGDILDYLEKLELKQFKFTPDFYWDIIFEMFMGVHYFHIKGYIHFDIKPANFIVDKDGYIILSDFGLSHKISELPFLKEIYEGDTRYISNELFIYSDRIFENKSKNIINTKCDIFSLGLTLLEIMSKVNLPINGNLWHELRSGEFNFTEEFRNKWNIKNNEEFIKLISEMILPFEKRPDLLELVEKYDELKKRHLLLKENKYEKLTNIGKN